MKNLKLSIITPSYNQGHFITETIESVLKQNYSNFEHIVVDGGSKDNTIEILKKYDHLKWISEPDYGAANAINKGLSMVTGDVMTWLNSDDYFEENIFKDIMDIFNTNGSDNMVMGALTFIDENKNINYAEKQLYITKEYLVRKSADYIRQPSTFFPVSAIKKLGGLDESYKLVFDYDLYLKLLSIYKPYYLEKNVVFQRDYSTTLSRKYARRQAFEIFKVSRKNGSSLFDRINLTVLKRIILNR